ncbi:hypothetical protein E2C01_093814 [Portunus trituberculatus]|uniref:Uncharacterized protein n=1 Tax=Portunus trituberculatus TaxID=210409 RepID=A0A5B7JVH2_PORTR|nr:hypothetical protein [Portunus trituberculatus]
MDRRSVALLMVLLTCNAATSHGDGQENCLEEVGRDTDILPYNSHDLMNLLYNICRPVNKKCECKSIQNQREPNVSAYCKCVPIMTEIRKGITCEISRIMIWIPRPILSEILKHQ